VSRSFNQVQLLGRVGTDVKLIKTSKDKMALSFSLGTGEEWTDKDTGEVKGHTDWHTCVVWDAKLADIVNKYVKKGNLIFITGALRNQTWVDKDKNNRKRTEVIVSELVMLEKKPMSPETKVLWNKYQKMVEDGELS